MRRSLLYIFGSVILVCVVGATGYSVFLDRSINASGQPSHNSNSRHKAIKSKPVDVASAARLSPITQPPHPEPKTPISVVSFVSAAADRDKAVGRKIRATIDHPTAQVIQDTITQDKVAAFVDTLYRRCRGGDYGKYTIACSDGQTMHYRLYVPKTMPGKKYPLVMYFHGMGQQGDNNVEQMCSTGAQAWSIADIQDKYPCYVAVPQLPDHLLEVADRNFKYHDWDMMAAQEYKELVQELSRKYPNLDIKRIYLSGHSIGGSCVYAALAHDPDLYAAGIPADGAGPQTYAYASVYAKHEVRLMPICGGPGDRCDAVIGLANNINAQGGKVTVVEYPNLDHNNLGDMWPMTSGLVDWLFAQHK